MAIERAVLEKDINRLLSIYDYKDYGPNGLQVEGKTELKKIAFAVSATKESIAQAAEAGADALFVHHGVFWKYQGAKPIKGAFAKRIIPLVKHDINLFAYHLPLDGHQEIGNARSLADLIEMQDFAPFAIKDKVPMGIKGTLKSPCRAIDLQKKLEVILNHTVVMASHDQDAIVKTLGIITGGANNDWIEAKRDRLDAYLTGEISEYNWHDAKEEEIHMFAGGHHATEKFGIQSLMKYISDKYGIACVFFDSENPA